MGVLIWVIIIFLLACLGIKKNTTGNEAAAEQKPVRPQAQAPAKTKMPEIVVRAKENSARYASTDITLEELETEHSHSERVAPAGGKHEAAEETKRAHIAPEDTGSFIDEESILGSVEDLMVKGYDGNLTFERDFVAEAMDMISSFTL